MKNIKIKNLLLAGASCLLLATSCDVDPTFYSQDLLHEFRRRLVAF